MDKLSGFKGALPRSQRSDNLAKILHMATSSQMQGSEADGGGLSDSESLKILSRLYRNACGSTKTQSTELAIAVETPVPEPDDEEDFYLAATDGRLIDSDVEWADTSSDDHFPDTVENDQHYDSLHKRSPAIVNPSYFDATHSSPSHGFGFGSSRYLDSSQANLNMSIDDMDFEDFNNADSPRQAGGFGLSGLEGSPSRSVQRPTLSFGTGRPYDREDPPLQILDIPMPHPDVLQTLANAPAREGKNSPFRSYYGHEPDLSDIDEESEPESDSGPAVIPSPLKNRHENRSRSHSIAKLGTSPFVRESSGSETPSKSPSQRRKTTSSTSPSNGSRASNNSGFVDQNSADGVSDDISAFGFHAIAGSFPKIEEEDEGEIEDEDAAKAREDALVACMKAPAPFVAPADVPAPLPFDFNNTRLVPRNISQDERTRLLGNEPTFIHDGAIPQEYVRFEEPPEPKSPPTTPKSDSSETDSSEQLPRELGSEGSHPVGEQPDRSKAERNVFPTRSSSLNATPRIDAAGSILAKSPTVLYTDETALYRQIAKDLVGTDAGVFADTLASQPIDHNADNIIGFILGELFSKNWSPKSSIATFMTEVHAVMAVARDIVEKSARSVMTAVEIYIEIFGGEFAKTTAGTTASLSAQGVNQNTFVSYDELESRLTTVTTASLGAQGVKQKTFVSYDDLETRVTGVPASAYRASAASDPFFDEPNVGFHGPLDETASIIDGGTSTAGASGMMPISDEISATSAPSRAVNVLAAVCSPTLRGRIAGTNVRSLVPGIDAQSEPFGGSDDDGGTLRDIANSNGRKAPLRTSAGSPGTPAPKPKAKPQYGLWPQPQRAANIRSPSEAVVADRERSVVKPSAVGRASSGSPSKPGASKRALSLNKPLPVISEAGESQERFPDVDVNAVSPDFPGLPGLQRTPAEKAQIAKVKRFGTGMRRRLMQFWSKSDEDLAVEQAAERENRAESANRLMMLAQNMDENQLVQTPTRSRRITSAANAAAAPAVGDGDNQALQTTTPKERGVRRTALAAAMGLGGRRKSIGENTRVNGA